MKTHDAGTWPPAGPDEHPEGEGCRSCGTAATFLAGRLAPDEQERFEAHVLGCPPCAEELETARRVIAELDAAAVAAADALASPPPALRARILSSLRRPADDASSGVQAWKRWTSPPGAEVAAGLATLRADDGQWEETGLPGVRVRSLAVDPERRYVTMLVRMEPGSDYPAHRHAGAEECLVLAGELSVGGTTLRPGDYQRADAGSIHGVQRSPTGCTLFIVSSQDDVLLPAAR